MTAPNYPVRPKILTHPDGNYPNVLVDNDILPWNHWVDGIITFDSMSGYTGSAPNTQWPFYGVTWCTGATSFFSVDFYLAAGTWNVRYPTDRRSDYCIARYLLDGTQMGPDEDRYAAAFSATSIYEYSATIAVAGWHRFTVAANGKNAAATTGYTLTFSGMFLSRMS